LAGTKIFQLVGYQNSGKTTVIKRLIEACRQRGLAVGTIKHHGHGGFPETNMVPKDSEKHRLAGARVSAVEGGGLLHLEIQKDSWDLEEIIRFYQLWPLDLILVEGYKHHMHPKAVMVRDRADWELLGQLHHIEAIVCKEPMHVNTNIPFFLLGDLEPFLDWFFHCFLHKEKDRE
jgi:molybdopterin-guanine dinucleotide biosynthesis protein B